MVPSNHNSETEIENNNINKKKKIKVAESSKNVTKPKKEKEKELKIKEEKKAHKIKEENKNKKKKEEVKNKDPKIKEAKKKKNKINEEEEEKKKKEQKNKEQQQQQKKKDPKNKEEKKKKKQKNNTKEKEKKKLNLSNGNGNLKQHHDDKPLIAPCSTSKVQKHDLKQEKGKEEDNAIVINGRISGTKPKKPKRKREEHEEEEEGEDAKPHAFPINRIRTVIKGEDPDSRVSHEAIIAINKATEKFLEQFTQDAYTRCVQDRKKSLSYMHLAYVVSKERRYDFLSDFVPGKVKAEDALRERNSVGNGGG